MTKEDILTDKTCLFKKCINTFGVSDESTQEYCSEYCHRRSGTLSKKRVARRNMAPLDRRTLKEERKEWKREDWRQEKFN